MVNLFSSFPHRSRPPRTRHRSRSRRPEYAEVPEPRFQVDLVDLDGVRESLRVLVKPTAGLSRVSGFLKQRFGAPGHGFISSDAKVRFYWVDKCLQGIDLPAGVSTLRYRVASTDGHDQDDGSVRVSWSRSLKVDDSLSQETGAALEQGATVGSLRKTIASLLEIEDPHRIIVAARGGLRPGPLQGNNWEVRKIKTWLCRHVFIDVAPPRSYIVFKGLNEEYIYHPHPHRQLHERFVDFRALRSDLLSQILTYVHRHGPSLVNINSDDITLLFQGNVLTKRWRVGLGRTVDFELTPDAANRFVAEEGWLVPLTESCAVCGDEKRASEMPTQISRSCEHKVNTCRDCVGQWIASSMDTLAWDRLKCPECPQLLRYTDVRASASRDVFRRYDELAMKAAVGNLRDFKWCLNPGCGSGQIHKDSCSKVKCHACRSASCAHHNLPWHSGETCEQYDKRTRRQRKNDKASELKVKEMTKACPKCRKDVHKYSGCDHITCVCGHEWCYICLATYSRDQNSFLQCKHKQDCKYFENPPNYEGARAFMPFLNLNRAELNRGPGFPRPPPPPLLRNWGPPPPRPAPAGPAGGPDLGFGGPFHGGGERNPAPVTADMDPFRFIMQDFLEFGDHDEVPVNLARQEPANDFFGGAAAFLFEQMMQRAR